MDETSQKIIDATMSLIRDKGYVATTTKDIARLAGVNECTLFRKFQNKKDIVLHGVSQEKCACYAGAFSKCAMGVRAGFRDVYERIYG